MMVRVQEGHAPAVPSPTQVVHACGMLPRIPAPLAVAPVTATP